MKSVIWEINKHSVSFFAEIGGCALLRSGVTNVYARARLGLSAVIIAGFEFRRVIRIIIRFRITKNTSGLEATISTDLLNLVTTMAKTEASDQQQLSNMDLAPSQTINASRRRNRGKSKAENSDETTQTTASSSQKDSAVESSGKPDAVAASASESTKPAAKKNRAKRNQSKKALKNAQEKGSEGKPNGDEQQGKQKKQPAKSNNNKGRNKRNNARKKYPWRKHLPADSVDPITLETLDSLTYPPFAMYASAPHLPIPEWPIPDVTETTSEPASVAAETEEDRQRRIISEQWGHKLTENETVVEEEELAVPTKRHYHLYDGRALAYYMVSQLQFIDPLNRRDLTRDELVNLDRYLRRHNFTDINVTEAYDTKGVTFSSAGATANTAAGRVAILQQLAGNLLNGLFGRSSVSPQQPSSQPSRPAAAAAPASSNRLMMQYQAHEQSQEQSNRRRNNSAYTSQDGAGGTDFPEDLGIYGDAGGVLVIDDDLHPGLRSNAVEFRPAAAGADGAAEGTGSNLFWSASHIAARYGHAAMVQQENFPSLARSAPAEPTSKLELLVAKKPAPSVKTLSRITKTVRKTDPDEVQRQWEAREDSRRKAALSQLTFGSNQAAWETSVMQDIPSSLPTTTSDGVPTEAQLERNRAFAQALGVAPATQRANLNAGWARPTQSTVELDEFGHELNATLYPDSLIMWVRENMGPVLKLERKWKAFLGDDTAQSLSMNHMDKPLRKRVHEYSDFWKLQTESFDPEPKRYIYCAKLRDTCAPYPLLSDAARNWRGPRPVLQSTTSSVPSDQQIAGQSTQGRELASGPDRVPLSLKPRSQPADSEPLESLPGMAISGARTLTMTEPDAALSSRFGALAVGRERSKLELQKRTIPLELPAYEQPKGFDFSEEVQLQKERVEVRARKEREAESRKQRALEAAFASSDEEGGGGRYDDDSEWSEDEQEALYAGEDEEEE
jgi:hypothetical protein